MFDDLAVGPNERTKTDLNTITPTNSPKDPSTNTKPITTTANTTTNTGDDKHGESQSHGKLAQAFAKVLAQPKEAGGGAEPSKISLPDAVRMLQEKIRSHKLHKELGMPSP